MLSVALDNSCSNEVLVPVGGSVERIDRLRQDIHLTALAEELLRKEDDDELLRAALSPFVDGKGALPTRSALRAAKRGDLVDRIERSGGFFAVSIRLGLRHRKPRFFYDDIEVLASDLIEFIEAQWTSHSAPDGNTYYYNGVTCDTRWDAPSSDDGDDDAVERVMPTRACLEAAGRWDLSNAVRLHGGTKAVAASLGWGHGGACASARERPTLASLGEELAAAAAETPCSRTLPTLASLRCSGRRDLVDAVVRGGGVAAAAHAAGLALGRSPPHRWGAPAAALRELRAFATARDAGAAAAGRKGGGEGAAAADAPSDALVSYRAGTLPSRGELLTAGRPDLAYALGKLRTAAAAEGAALRPRRLRGVKLPFGEARSVVRGLRLATAAEWRAWCAVAGQRPLNIPANPAACYRGKGWAGWSDWLGASRQEAKERAAPLHLQAAMDILDSFRTDLSSTQTKNLELPATDLILLGNGESG